MAESTREQSQQQYLASWLQGIATFSSHEVALALAGLGAAGLIGNVAVPWLDDGAWLHATVAVVLAVGGAGACPVFASLPSRSCC